MPGRDTRPTRRDRTRPRPLEGHITTKGRFVALLLTGATGMIGGELLLRLLERDRRRIICLIRARNSSDAAARGELTLQRVLGREPHPAERDRVQWICADLQQRRLGLRKKTWSALAQQVTEIYHCAAVTNPDLPLTHAHRTNVDGVAHLLELAESAGSTFRRMHHMSTAFVAGRTRGRVQAGYLPPDREAHFRNSFERTKARAERLIQSQSQVPVTIYRPSFVAGATQTGRTTHWNEAIYSPMRRLFEGENGHAPKKARGRIDTVGVDFVVDGLLTLARRPATHGTTYHLTAGPKAFSLGQFVATCEQRARFSRSSIPPVAGASRAPSPRVSFAWIAGASRHLLRIGNRRPFSVSRRSLGRLALYASTRTEFECGLEHRWLEARGVVVPRPEQYLRKIIDFAIKRDFGRIPEQRTSGPRLRLVEPEALSPTG